MNYLNRLLVLIAMFFSMSIAAGGNINLYYKEADNVLYLEKSEGSCTIGDKTNFPELSVKLLCVMSKNIGPTTHGTVLDILRENLNQYWKKEADVDEAQHQSSTLKLLTDIDFEGKLNVSGENYSCEKGYTHEGIEFSGDVLDGNGKTISNICRAVNADKWDTPMGLFNTISNGIIQNLKIDDVNFVVLNKTESTSPFKGTVPGNEANYKPVGALAGTIENSRVSDITLGKINVSAPLAGGLAGYVENSIFENIETESTGAIIVTNDIGLKINEDNSKMGTYKTILGGLVGVSKVSSFKNIDLNLYMESSAVVDSSALGGVAGLYIYADKKDKSYWNKKIKITVPASVEGPAGSVDGYFTGATTIGGVFGETKREVASSSNNTRLYIDSVEVINLHASAIKVAGNKPIGVYWGGVVGKSDLCLGGSLKISHTQADVKFNVSSLTTGTYKNYWGGIAGYAGCSSTNNFGSDDDLGLSIKNSKATGNMTLGGGGGFSQIYASSTIGGLVGEALLSVEKNAVMQDTSLVSITYSAKNTVDVLATTVTQTVHVGGIIGAANLFKNTGDISYWKGLIFKGNLDITDDGFDAYVGGIVGRFPLNGSDNSPMAFRDISVQTSSNKLIDYKTNGSVTYTSDAFLGGVCGNCNSISKIEETAIVGDISKSASTGIIGTINKSFDVGGLVGRVKISSYPIYVYNTYSKGNITSGFPSGSNVGFLFGTLSGNTGKSSEFMSNYHYSENEEEVAAIADGDGDEYSNFDPVYSNSKAVINVRNCSAKKWTKSYNGCDLSSDMASENFKFMLNSVWPDSKDKVWEYIVQGDAVTLPTLRKSSYVNIYTVTFNGLDGQPIKTFEVNDGESVTAPAASEVLPYNGMCFTGWNDTYNLSKVTGDWVIEPNSKACEYTVKFMNADGSETYKTETVEYNKSATPPGANEVPQKVGDQCFEKWDSDFNKVKSDLNIKAKYKVCEDFSSSSETVQQSSSSIEAKSSSSTATPKSSNSYIRTIASPTAKHEGSALRMAFNDSLASKHPQVDYHIVVKSDVGIYLDTVVSGKHVEHIKNGTWRLDPAPVGEYRVSFTLSDGSDSVSYDMSFKAEKEKQVELISNSWQTYSLYAFCHDESDKCKSVWKQRFSRQQEIWTVEECKHMKEELAQSPDDEDFREYVERICSNASDAQNGAMTSVFWWDETNPVGDYWQYRRYDESQDFDSTRGYWYGPVEDESLSFSLQTPNMDDEIIWKLENRYSGWNLVANPFGWFVKLPQGDEISFRKWDPNVSDNVPVDTLGPYEAIWVYTEKSREYRIPLKAAIVLEGETKSFSKSAVDENWNLRVVLADNNGKRDAWNELATGREVSSLREPPAGMGDRVNLSIVEGKQRLAKSVKVNDDDLEWNLEASATTSRDGKLSFVGLESIWAKGLHVYATVGDEMVEIVNDHPVNVNLSSKAKNVSVRVTKSAIPVNVAKNLLSGFRVNQTPNVLNVGFDAASKLAGANVMVRVVGIDGRVVATSKAVAQEGSNAVLLKKPKQGVYFVRLKVGSQTATTRFLVR